MNFVMNLIINLYKMTHQKSIFRFGLIADIQYANIPDGTNYSRSRKRYYRNSLKQLQSAVTEWGKQGVEFVIDLGDILDGQAAKIKESEANLQTVLDIYKTLDKDVYFHWGNHDFYNFTRESLTQMEYFNSSLKAQAQKPENCDFNYYAIDIHKNFKFVFLDCYEISMLGYSDKSDASYTHAEGILRRSNPNEELNSPRGMGSDEVRFVQYNGGVSDKQLQWLDGVLSNCDTNKQNVIITSHISVLKDSGDNHTLIWNCEEILEILHRHSCVMAFIAGHNHDGGYAVDSHGIHHLTLHGVIESPPGLDTFAVVHVERDNMIVKGYGRAPHHLVIPLKHEIL